MIWLMVAIMIWSKEQNLIKNEEIKRLKLQVSQNIMVMKEDWLQWFTIFFDKKSAGSGAKSMPINNLQMSFINKWLGNLKDA